MEDAAKKSIDTFLRIRAAQDALEHKCDFQYEAPMPEYASAMLKARTVSVSFAEEEPSVVAAALELLVSAADRLLSIKYRVFEKDVATNADIDAAMEELDNTDGVGLFFACFDSDHDAGANLVATTFSVSR